MKNYQNILILIYPPVRHILHHLGAIATIRRFYPDATISILTHHSAADILKQANYADHIMIDRQQTPLDLKGWWQQIQALRNGHYDLVIDLQKTKRTEWFFRLIGRKKPDWSGAISWCSHPTAPVEATSLPTKEAVNNQLHTLGIKHVLLSNIDFLHGSYPPLQTDRPLAIIALNIFHNELIDNSSGILLLSEICDHLALTHLPVLVGHSVAWGEETLDLCSHKKVIQNLCGQLDYADLASLARDAAINIGGIDDYTYISAMAGCPSIILHPSGSHVNIQAPQAEKVLIFELDGSVADLKFSELKPQLDIML